jgi:hypothetical protein
MVVAATRAAPAAAKIAAASTTAATYRFTIPIGAARTTSSTGTERSIRTRIAQAICVTSASAAQATLVLRAARTTVAAERIVRTPGLTRVPNAGASLAALPVIKVLAGGTIAPPFAASATSDDDTICEIISALAQVGGAAATAAKEMAAASVGPAVKSAAFTRCLPADVHGQPLSGGNGNDCMYATASTAQRTTACRAADNNVNPLHAVRNFEPLALAVVMKVTVIRESMSIGSGLCAHRRLRSAASCERCSAHRNTYDARSVDWILHVTN